jgi:hypothetical protein
MERLDADDWTPAMNRIFENFKKVDGVHQVMANKALSRKVWTSSKLGGAWMDCASGIFSTKRRMMSFALGLRLERRLPCLGHDPR